MPTVPVLQPAMNAGEISPALFGRTDLAKYHTGTSTLRNMFASYRGAASSRGGTLYCGQCKQGNLNTANSVLPPRNVPFQYSANVGFTIEMGDHYFRFLYLGAYITEASFSISAVTMATPGTFTVPGNNFSNGDEVFVSGIGGPIQVNNQTYIVINKSGDNFNLASTLDGHWISTASFAAYTGGGQMARIYTLATPYAIADVALLKFAQSADVMSIVHQSYPPYDLMRITNSNWQLVKTSFASSISAPANCSVSQECATTVLNFWYQFVATAVDATTGQESIASPVASVLTCDQATIAGTMTVNCAPVSGAGSYNFYRGPEAYNSPPTPGGIFGYVGSSFGPTFTDTNVTPDFTTSPPLNYNPFATSPVTMVTVTAQGSGYNSTTTTATITSPTGKNPVIVPIVQGGAITWISVQSGGEGLTGSEPVVITDSSGSGSGASATFTTGPATGTYPGVVAYFQQRRFYASTANNPDTYFASQPGSFTNMDSSIPTVDDDAIVGSPWSQQVNGIQFMVNMPGGLVVLTGLGAWQLGGGGSATAVSITPKNQVATPQAYNGCSPVVPPIIINYDVLYVQEKGSIVRDLNYNFFTNIYTGTDMTVLSNHLFDGFQILQWGWAEEPNKLLWAIRNDGTLLCMTYLKEQDVYAWSRHDTNGLFQSVCTISEPPVNAPYFVVKRLIQNNGNPVWAYFQERMDNRIWNDLLDVWCVDAGLAYPQNEPNATLTISSSTGVLTLTTPDLVYGGSNYSGSTYATIDDPTGTGAVAAITIVGGVVTTASVSGTLTGYTDPTFKIVDPTGAGGGAAVNIFVRALATVTASAAVFSNAAGNGEAGDVIRISGKQLEVIQFLGASSLLVQIRQPPLPSIPNDPHLTAAPAAAGNWSIAAPIQTVWGLNHLEGMEVSILADGVIVEPQVVSNGSITLPQPASTIVVGLGFEAQCQTLYLDMNAGGVTVQGRRKKIDNVIVRLYKSGLPFEIGVNQPDTSVQPDNIPVAWANMGPADTPNNAPSDPLQPNDLFTGDIFANVFDQLGYDKGQVAIQQTAPVPLNVLATVTWVRLEDDPDGQ